MTNSTAVARREDTGAVTTEQVKEAAKQHPAVIESRVRNALAQQLRGTQWGKELNAHAIRAVAEYAHRYGLDPISEIEILGGRIYRTANYYERRGAEMIAAGEVEYIKLDHIAHDPRLDEMAGSDVPEDAEWARREIVRRAKLRMQHGAPDKAAAVVVTRIKVPGLTEEIVGCNWCGGGVRRGDPVGDAEPTKTAETRSKRRAWKQLTTHVPALAQHEAEMDDGGVAVSAVVREDRAAVKRQAEEPKALASGDVYEMYGQEPPQRVRSEREVEEAQLFDEPTDAEIAEYEAGDE